MGWNKLRTKSYRPESSILVSKTFKLQVLRHKVVCRCNKGLKLQVMKKKNLRQEEEREEDGKKEEGKTEWAAGGQASNQHIRNRFEIQKQLCKALLRKSIAEMYKKGMEGK